MDNECSLTVIIKRNSDGEIINEIKCNAIFAGFGVTNDGGAAYSLTENAKCGMVLAAASCAERAIAAYEENDPAFKAIRFLEKMLKEREDDPEDE